jgi:hypothetical protein
LTRVKAACVRRSQHVRRESPAARRRRDAHFPEIEMMRFPSLAFVVGSLLAAASVPAVAADAPAQDPVAAALLGGKPTLSFRLRYETVEDEAMTRDATAATLRTRLGWQSGAYAGVKAAIEVDDIRALVDDYNAVSSGDPTRPIVADPEGTEFNVAALTWSGDRETVGVGRQRITFDDQRFVGAVGWRQNEQTYDAVQLRTKRLARTELAYAYVADVNRIYGPQGSVAQSADWHGDSHFLNAKIDAGTAGTVAAFAYLLRFDNAAPQSNDTYGVRWSGTAPATGRWKVPFTVSYATQQDAGRNPVGYSADYYLVEGGLACEHLKLLVGREVLSGDATRAGHRFQTPLATLHAFQGWADKFLVTPPQGIEDTYLTVSGKYAGVDLTASYHDYGAEAVGRDYGTEWNLQASHKFAGRYDLLAKLADYRADGYGRDTRKVWVQFVASF